MSVPAKATSQRVAICIATFRRPAGLRRLLTGIASQSYGEGPTPAVRVIVVDNEASAETRALCELTAKELGLHLDYVAEPRTGIAYARNAALDATTSADDWLCFIDDDEVPAGSWLQALLDAQRRSGADCVAGKVVPLFPPGTPNWIIGGSYFGSRASRTGVPVPATSNSMIRRAAVERLGLRFDTAFAAMGGDDTLFFRQAAAGGVRIVWAADAVVHEHVVPGRLRLFRVMRRQFREGCTLSQCDLAMGATWRGMAMRLAKGAGNLVIAAALLPLCLVHGFDALARSSCRCARGLGTLAGLAGLRFEEYRPDRNRDT